MNDIEARITQLENNMKTLLSVRRTEDERNENEIESNKISLNETNKNFVETSTSLEEALCDIDAAASDRLADLEEALCELSEIMEEGGNENG